MTTSQKAIVAAKARGVHDKAAKERQKASGGDHRGKPVPTNWSEPPIGDSREAAGVALGVSGMSVDRATNILKKGVPEVVEAVEAGKMTVNKGAEIAKHPPAKQRGNLASITFIP